MTTTTLRIRAIDTRTDTDCTTEEMLGDALYARYHIDNRAQAEAHAAELAEDRADYDIPDYVAYVVTDR
jgi:hypothetical protein